MAGIRTLTAAAAAVAIAAALTSCSVASSSKAQPHATSTASSSATPALPADPSPAQAEAAAAKVFAAWSDRALDYNRWWAQLSPLLSTGAQSAYEYTNPAEIPALTVTGPLTVTTAAQGPAAAPGGANVRVPTSRGVFIVQLEHWDGQWLMYGMQFPEGVQ